LARRRDRTAAPALVFIRARKPCVFERWRRLGWNVRLGIELSWIRESLPYGQVLSIADSVQIRQSLRLPARSLRRAEPFPRSSRFIQHTAQRVFVRTREVFRRRESSSSLAPLLRLHRISVVNSPQNLSVFEVTSRVFTSSGATYFFADNAVHSMLPSVLVSAPFTTEFSGVKPNPGSNKRQRTDSPSRRDSGRGAKKLEPRYRRCKVASDSERSRSIKEWLHRTDLTTSQHLNFGSDQQASRLHPPCLPSRRRAVASFSQLLAIHPGARAS
jgi:hypothetical protein